AVPEPDVDDHCRPGSLRETADTLADLARRRLVEALEDELPLLLGHDRDVLFHAHPPPPVFAPSVQTRMDLTSQTNTSGIISRSCQGLPFGCARNTTMAPCRTGPA